MNDRAARIRDCAQVLWDYHQMHMTVAVADIIFVLGSNDIRVADRAAELFRAGYADRIVVSGNVGKLTLGLFGKAEALAFADRLEELGIPRGCIVTETQATNTGENVVFTRRLLESMGLRVASAICVQKPFMERRTFATVAKQWPELRFTVTSPEIPFADYCNAVIGFDDLLHVMVGDLQRIRTYPALGYQIPQDVPDHVVAACDALVAMGFDRHPIPG